MSVPTRDRSESEIDYHYDAVMVDRSLIQLALRDFGVKSKPKSVDFYTKITKMSKEDAKLFQDILVRNNLDTSIVEVYPDWLINYFRDKLLETSNSMAYHVEVASRLEEIGINTYNEFIMRQQNQDMAYAECEEIYRQLQRIMDVLPIDANKLMPYTGSILSLEEEILNWRSLCNQEIEKYRNK